jgi:hypothetical protein
MNIGVFLNYILVLIAVTFDFYRNRPLSLQPYSTFRTLFIKKMCGRLSRSELINQTLNCYIVTLLNDQDFLTITI